MKCLLEQVVYIRSQQAEALIVSVYVDNLIVTGTSVEDIKYFKKQMMKEFKMTDL